MRTTKRSGFEIGERDRPGIGETVHGADHDLEILGEQRPRIEAVPFLAEIGAETKLGVAALEIGKHLFAVAAIELQLEAFEQFPELDHMRHDERRVDGLRQGEPERADLAALDGGSERAGAHGAVVALLEQRQHALAELGQLRLRPLAAEQIAAKLAFELADGAGEGGLGHVTFLRRAREIERARHGEEVADLMHFHKERAPLL